MHNSTFGEALVAFKNQDFQEAFDCCNQMPVKETIRLLLVTKEKSIFSKPEFWDAFISKSTQQSEILNSDYSDRILFDYWKNFPHSGDRFFDHLSKRFPKKLIDSIRLNEVFLYQKKWEKLTSSLHLNIDQYIHNHYLFMDHLIKQKRTKKSNFEIFEKEISSLTIYELLTYLSLWYEYNRLITFNKEEENYNSDLQPFVRAINYCLNQQLSKSNITSIKPITEREFYQVEILVFKRWKHSPESIDWFFIYMDAIISYQKYEEGVLHSYCFDLNTEIENEDNNFKFYPLNKPLYKRWIQNGEKLDHFFDLTKEHSKEAIETALQANTITISGTDEVSIRINKNAMEQSHQTGQSLNYYGIGNSDNMFLQKLVYCWNGFSSNALARLVYPLTKKYGQGETWLDDILSNLEDQRLNNATGSALPLWIGDEKSVFDAVKNGLLNIENQKEIISTDEEMVNVDNEALRITSEMMFEFTENKKINICITPFFKIHKTIFCFYSILAETNVPLWVVNHFLEKDSTKERKDETELMEKRLSDLISEKLKITSTCSKKHFPENKTKEDAEYDVLSYSNGVLLIIEMKRTKISLTLNDTNTDYKNNILKAAIQLYNGEEVLKNDFIWLKSLFPEMKEESFNQLKIEKLIVTNSFEKDHELVDGILKISLFELEEELEIINPDEGKNKIDQLMNKIKEENYWKNKIRSLNDIKDTELPTDHYRLD